MPRWRPWKRTEEQAAAAAPERDPERERQLARLRQRRDAARYDVEQAELATRPENPWQARIALLDEAIATVEADLARLAERPPAPYFPLPPTPITGVTATTTEPAEVRFSIGPEAFHFTEEIDWDQRGGAVVRGDLRRRAGDAARLIPAETPADLREPLTRHLTDSLAVFATDLRDRALDGEPLPAAPTLADLARPCPICGGWQDWRGTCAVCAQRAWERQQLEGEARRLAAEQDQEADDRHRWAERLPVARRRLAQAEAELTKLGD